MTKRQRREYFRRWRARARHVCECGQTATVKSADGLICQRCADLEYRRERLNAWRARKRHLFGGLEEHRIGVVIP